MCEWIRPELLVSANKKGGSTSGSGWTGMMGAIFASWHFRIFSRSDKLRCSSTWSHYQKSAWRSFAEIRRFWKLPLHRRCRGSVTEASVRAFEVIFRAPVLGHLLALKVSAVNKQELAQVADLARGPTRDQRQCENSFRRSGLYGRVTSRSCCRKRNRSHCRRTCPSKKRNCPFFQTLDCRSLLCLGSSLPPSFQGLSTPAHFPRQSSLAGFSQPHAQLRVPLKFMTRSKLSHQACPDRRPVFAPRSATK